MNTKKSAYIVAALLGFALPAYSAIITTWDAPVTIGNSSQVNTEGTLILARQATLNSPPTHNGWNDQTVNGVTFSSSQDTQNGVTLSLGGFTYFQATGFVASAGATLSGTDAVAYAQMLDGVWGGTTNPITLTLSGLTTGQEYLIQIWAADFRGISNVRTETVTTDGGTDINSPTLSYLTGVSGNPGTGTGQFAIGRFTADSGSVTFNLTGNESSQLNAFQLRAVPEPSAYALLGLSMVGWFLISRRRKVTA